MHEKISANGLTASAYQGDLSTMATIFDRKTNKNEDQIMAELKRWWARNPNASLLELEAVARDLGHRNRPRFSLIGKRARPATMRV